MEQKTLLDKSYLAHIAFEKQDRDDNHLPSEFINPGCVDAWRHERMKQPLDPLLTTHPGASWLTIGDGHFGSDAYYLQQRGANVTASSISDETLAISHKQGYIKKYKCINAEQIAEADGAYDYVLCKEAFHHFPRPFVGFYEMLRVAAKALVFIEPQERRHGLLDYLKRFIKLNIRKDQSVNFEPSGNFIYRLNVREMHKAMAALNYRTIAYYRFNDLFIPSAAGYPRNGFNKGILLTKLGIAFQNLLCRLGLMDWGLAVVILFKSEPDAALLQRLRSFGYTIENLPVNPFHNAGV